MYFWAETGRRQGRPEARATGAKPGGMKVAREGARHACMPAGKQIQIFSIFAKFRKEIGSQQSVWHALLRFKIFSLFLRQSPPPEAGLYMTCRAKSEKLNFTYISCGGLNISSI